QALDMGLDQLGQALENASSLRRPHAGPRSFVEGPPGGGHRRLHVFPGPPGDLFPGRLAPGVDRLEGGAVGSLAGLAVDDVGDHDGDPALACRSAMSSPPAMNSVGCISVIQTRIEASGAPMDSWAAWVRAVMSAFFCSAVRPAA